MLSPRKRFVTSWSRCCNTAYSWLTPLLVARAHFFSVCFWIHLYAPTRRLHRAHTLLGAASDQLWNSQVVRPSWRWKGSPQFGWCLDLFQYAQSYCRGPHRRFDRDPLHDIEDREVRNAWATTKSLRRSRIITALGTATIVSPDVISRKNKFLSRCLFQQFE